MWWKGNGSHVKPVPGCWDYDWWATTSTNGWVDASIFLAVPHFAIQGIKTMRLLDMMFFFLKYRSKPINWHFFPVHPQKQIPVSHCLSPSTFSLALFLAPKKQIGVCVCVCESGCLLTPKTRPPLRSWRGNMFHDLLWFTLSPWTNSLVFPDFFRQTHMRVSYKRGTPNHPFIDGFSLTKTIQLLGYPHFRKPPSDV